MRRVADARLLADLASEAQRKLPVACVPEATALLAAAREVQAWLARSTDVLRDGAALEVLTSPPPPRCVPECAPDPKAWSALVARLPSTGTTSNTNNDTTYTGLTASEAALHKEGAKVTPRAMTSADNLSTNAVANLKPVANVVANLKPVANAVANLKSLANGVARLKPVANVVANLKPVANALANLKPVAHLKPVVNPMAELTPVANVKSVTNASSDAVTGAIFTMVPAVICSTNVTSAALPPVPSPQTITSASERSEKVKRARQVKLHAARLMQLLHDARVLEVRLIFSSDPQKCH